MLILNLVLLLILVRSVIIYLINLKYLDSEILNFCDGDNSFLKIYDDFLTDNECEYLIKKYKDKCVKSMFLGDNTEAQNDTVRNSYDYGFEKNTCGLITKIENKLSKIINVPVENFEEIQFIKYKKDNFYKKHFDYFNIKNDRIYTAIIYLNTLEKSDGGYTQFINYNEEIQPIKGRAIVFKNIVNDKPYPYSLHRGEKVNTNKEKYILSCWIRKYKFDE